jgi:hypothetical protein
LSMARSSGCGSRILPRASCHHGRIKLPYQADVYSQ